MLKFGESDINVRGVRLGESPAEVGLHYDVKEDGWHAYADACIFYPNGTWKDCVTRYLGVFPPGDKAAIVKAGNVLIPEILHELSDFVRAESATILDFIADYRRKEKNVPSVSDDDVSSTVYGASITPL